MLYSVHREYEGVKEDEKMWVSRDSGLLLRVEEDFDNRGKMEEFPMRVICLCAALLALSLANAAGQAKKLTNDQMVSV
jgi:hypothetical protein